MLTQQGGQVIIPNADLIANRFVNWTINSAYIKSETIFKINMAADINKVTQIIRDELTGLADVVKGSEPEVMINSVAADAIELKVLVWISSIYVEPQFKSRLFDRLLSRLATENIKIM